VREAEASLAQYVPALRQVAIVRMVRQLGDVYSVMRVSSLSELAPFIAFGEVRVFLVPRPPARLLACPPARSLWSAVLKCRSQAGCCGLRVAPPLPGLGLGYTAGS
jgi:hypothetical protein